jgi:hypothetical protein
MNHKQIEYQNKVVYIHKEISKLASNLIIEIDNGNMSMTEGEHSIKIANGLGSFMINISHNEFMNSEIFDRKVIPHIKNKLTN